MTDSARIKIAAFATAMFLAAMSIAGVIAHAGRPAPVATISGHPTAMMKAARTGQPQLPQAWHEQDQHE
jgi:hypothetical protein